jgi:hypothetical protein
MRLAYFCRCEPTYCAFSFSDRASEPSANPSFMDRY